MSVNGEYGLINAVLNRLKNLAASWVTSGRFPVDRLPAMTDEKIWKGTGANVEEVDMPSGIVSGLIVMWHGTIANIPAGFVICDGNNATPNLLTRFVQGVATAATDPGATGGATSKTTAGHTHARSAQPNANQFAANSDFQHDSATDSIADIRPLFYDVAFLMKT